MNNIKTILSIKDLENLSGIKAHTIRIWEKRYNLLEPLRTDTNIRTYDVSALTKLLNVTLLLNHGYKISKISQHNSEQIANLVKEITTKINSNSHAVSAFKRSMMEFDQSLFFRTYDELLAQKSFREVFYQVFIPLIEEIGLLWQTNTILPAHEHFISYLIKQKILVNTAQIQTNQPTKTDTVFVLYLPMHEIHELGIMYLNYEILSLGYQSIFLGESLPVENLKEFTQIFEHVTFLSYFTVEPNPDELDDYMTNIGNNILTPNSSFWVTGRLASKINPNHHNQQIKVFSSIAEIINEIS
ncbi:MAG: MerR family transcriptional regulator [Bacteroidetes bacterium]|nr:MerR family transcriptional regulator [Bacteroidota bacterium]